MKRIYVHVWSGLASRCYTLADAYYLAKRFQRKLIIIWPISKDCSISYYDVFANEQFQDISMEVIEVNADGFCVDREKKYHRKLHIKTKLTELLYRICDAYMEYTPSKKTGWSGEKYIKHLNTICNTTLRNLEEGHKCWVHAYYGIEKGGKKPADIAAIQFKDMYWSRVRELFPQGCRMIGVHIRRTDHKVCIEKSKTEWFIENMNQYLAEDSSVCFFLATDDADEEKRLQTIFPEKIITNRSKSYGRDSLNGMQDAVVDLLCLSQCEVILGSCTSVFSKFGAEYGGKELILNE